jgi:2-succinyl-5-enolpyruvyl-6-hydroxy-3-cyclohexene-1-carboxylate synthase
VTKHYTDEKNALLVIALLKANGIRQVVASPGATNVTLVSSLKNDSFFKIYSAVDERSAAYMACGLAHESGEPVVISCTGATSSRNYMPGLTEAYYRKLPILAITSTQAQARIGHHVAQVTDRSVKPADTQRFSVQLPIVKDDEDWWDCEVKVNQAILELKRDGGGPVHVNLPTRYSKNYEVEELPECRVMDRFCPGDTLPELKGRVAVFIGSHQDFTAEETEALDGFCSTHDAVVFCDHTSGYNGKYRLLYSLAASQDQMDILIDKPDITIHIGEISGDYASLAMTGKQVWRVNPDGEIRDTFRRLKYVFAMSESTFFKYYSGDKNPSDGQYLKQCNDTLDAVRSEMPDLPFSNIWCAEKTADRLPENSVLHLAILNSLRSWNLFEVPKSVRTISNVGGFGIDGAMSSMLGASLYRPDQLYFCVTGDLAFFYDMNALGNRHVGKNIRILVINNGKGTEFRQYNHVTAQFGDAADDFIAAAGHFGNKSPELIKGYVEGLGFNYLVANNKDEFLGVLDEFLNPNIGDRPVVLEVFTDSEEESKALEMVRNIKRDRKVAAKAAARKILGDGSINAIKKVLKK